MAQLPNTLDILLSSLAPEQQKPLQRSTPNACILAAAGSGKTRTLIQLLLSDLAKGIKPADIVAITYTEKAAEELMARVYMLGKNYFPDLNLSGMYVGTIHAWCLQYLTNQSSFRSFNTLDELQAISLISRLYDFLDIANIYDEPYPKGIDKFCADIEVTYNEHLQMDKVPVKIRPAISKLMDILSDNRLMTFGGMIRYATEHLTKNGPVANLESLYVDEYQDVNPAQVALIKAMLPEKGRIVVVGDDLQCIYNWRGSDVTRILTFHSEFPNASIFRLNTNYRSRPPIVGLGNSIAQNVTLRDPLKEMKPTRSESLCQSIYWISLKSEEDQANAISQIVQRFYATGVPYNKIAVLLRSVIGSGRPIVDALMRDGIPVQCPILSRGGSFIDQFLLPVLDWLRSEHTEPHNEVAAAEAEKKANELWTSVKPWLPVGTKESVFWKHLARWEERIDKKHADAYDVRGRFYDLLDACSIGVGPNDSDLMVGLGIASQIIRSVEEAHRHRIRGQARRTPRGIMSETYYAVIHNRNDFGESLPINTSPSNGVLIATVHQAKGLEWPVVILPTLMSRRFPVNQHPQATSFPDEIAGRYGTSQEDEWRLFYVAATRARERLFLLDTGAESEKSRSIFLQKLQRQGAINVARVDQIAPSVWFIPPTDREDSAPVPLRTGLSDLLLYLECPFQFGLRRVVSLQPSIGDELGFGEGLHALIQRKLDDNVSWSDTKLQKEVEEHVHLPYMSEDGEAKSRQAIAGRVQKLEKVGVFRNKVESEVKVEVLLRGGVIHGIIDGIEQMPDGSVIIRDWKSNVHTNFLLRYERQLQFYTYALSLQGKRVVKADIVDIAATAEKGSVVTVDVDITSMAITKLVNTLEDALVGISVGRFDATPEPKACERCDMYRLCSMRCTDDLS